MQQRVRMSHRGNFLRPPGKLPVPVALNAGLPTLFRSYYTPFDKKSK